MATAQDYRWLEDTLGDAACVTVVIGSDEAEVLRAFRADASVTVPLQDAVSFAEDDDEDEAAGESYVSVLTVPGAVIAVEDNGYQGSSEDVLGPLSAGGRAASMFWNVNDDNAFSCARGGEVLASVDMYDAEDPDSVELPDELVALFATAGEEGVDLHAVGLAMVEQYTGIRVTPEHISALDIAHPVRSST